MEWIREMKSQINLTWIAILLALAVWTSIAAIDTFIHGTESFGANFLTRGGNELLLRSLISFLIVGFGAVAQKFVLSLRASNAHTKKLNRLLKFLSHTNTFVQRQTTRQSLLDAVCHAAVEKGGFRLAWVGMDDDPNLAAWAVDDPSLEELALQKQAPAVLQACHGALGVMKDGGPVHCEKPRTDCQTSWLAAALKQGSEHTYTVPLMVGNKIVGVFEVYAKESEQFGEDEEAILNEVGNGLSVALTNFEHEESRKQAETELRISATAFESQECIMITEANGEILRVNEAFTKDTGYTAEEIVGHTPRLLKSGHHNAAFYQEMWQILGSTGMWQGEIWGRRKNGELYPKYQSISAVKGEGGVITHYVAAHIDITERKTAEKEIQLLEFYDPLTHLPNRRQLMGRLQHALASSDCIGREGALMLIDLDNFKILNDTRGHDTGDLLLQQVARRLESCVRDGDTVARLGGDEFVVILESLSEHPVEAAEQTKAVGEKILASLSQTCQLDTSEYHCSASIGATLFKGSSQAITELMKQADIAMYQAKNAGRNTVRFFNPQMQDNITARAALEGDLRKAIKKQQFQLYYQIQMDSSFRPLGAEALIRWIHPERGMVSPMEFIPLAEETGLILPIGQWVIEMACAQLNAWQQDLQTRGLVLAVNVSAKQFRQPDFVFQVKNVMQRYSVNPGLLKLELTEGMLLEDIEETIATMNTLNRIGVKFSLDDFGTGYSSLQYLKRLPLAQLKIDQSFVRDIATNSNDREIVQTIIAMAKSLNLEVIAEGVETEEERQILLNKGCASFQGYLIGRPMPITRFEALLNQAVAVDVRDARCDVVNLRSMTS